MDLQSFINQYNGQKGVGNTPENKGECVGLVMVYLKDYLKLPHVWGHAMDLLKNADKNAYDIVYNTPTGIPPRGSVIVFKKSFNGTFGHTGIVTKADVNTFELFEQNMPTGAGCRLHTYPNYAHVDGWIIPKAPNVIPVEKKTFENLVSKATERDEYVKIGTLEEFKKLKTHKCPPQRSYAEEKKQIIEIVNKIG